MFSWHYLHVKSSFHVLSLVQKEVIQISSVDMLIILLHHVQDNVNSLIIPIALPIKEWSLQDILMLFSHIYVLVPWLIYIRMQPYLTKVKKNIHRRCFSSLLCMLLLVMWYYLAIWWRTVQTNITHQYGCNMSMYWNNYSDDHGRKMELRCQWQC